MRYKQIRIAEEVHCMLMLLAEDQERGEGKHIKITKIIIEGAKFIPYYFIEKGINPLIENKKLLAVRLNLECKNLRQGNSAQELVPLADAIKKPFSVKTYNLIENAMYDLRVLSIISKKVFCELAIYLYVREKMKPREIRNITERVRQQMMLKAAKEAA